MKHAALAAPFASLTIDGSSIQIARVRNEVLLAHPGDVRMRGHTDHPPTEWMRKGAR